MYIKFHNVSLEVVRGVFLESIRNHFKGVVFHETSLGPILFNLLQAHWQKSSHKAMIVSYLDMQMTIP